jgi:hypothetical protein
VLYYIGIFLNYLFKSACCADVIKDSMYVGLRVFAPELIIYLRYYSNAMPTPKIAKITLFLLGLLPRLPVFPKV